MTSTTSREAWQQFFSHATSTRLPAARFGKFAQLLCAEYPMSSIQICDLLLRPPQAGGESLDARIPEYVVELLNNGMVEVADCLRALQAWSNWRTIQDESLPAQTVDGINAANRRRRPRWNRSWVGDEAVLFGITKAVTSSKAPKGEKKAVELLIATTEWAKLLADINFTPQVNNEGIAELNDEDHARMQDLMTVRIAFGTYLMALSENAVVLSSLQKECPKSVIKGFAESLSIFGTTLLGNSQQISQQLEAFRSQTLAPLIPVDKKAQAATDEINKILDSTMGLALDSVPVTDLPVVNSRAGLYVYLSALLVAKPIVDDNAIFNYLQNRYQGDIQSTCIDLISASFDVLANAIFRKESHQTTIVLRSFLINKVPLLLHILSASLFPPLSAEFCITQALSNVDTNAFPTLSSMFDETSSGNMFGDSVRQDFCFACCLHGLLPEESIERLLGEIPMQGLPTGGRYTKDELVQQCLADHDRTENLLDEMENMDGNVGAVCQTIAEMIGQFCRSKETMALKTLCTHLARKPSCLDIMLLFEKPSTILQPLRELLDNWHHDEDLGEYQPVYEEFGGILLLVMAYVYRYNLSVADLGIQSNDSFVAKWLVRGSIGRTMDELSDQEKNQLDVWIRGLFNAEGGGLGDEPMSACPPQSFYLLVPTLFQQIVLACSTGHLNDEILKGGLEYLVETFLLPSLVGAFFWLSNHLWEAHGDSNSVITILQCLMQPSSNSTEASAMLGSILNIVAKPLEHSLRTLQRSDPSRQDVMPLLKVLSSHANYSRTGGSVHTELESWTAAPGGGLIASIRHTFQQLVQWSLTPGLNVMPTPYTHRQILAGLRMLGAMRLNMAIIAEVKQQTLTGSGAIALDVATAIICAPDMSTIQQQGLNLMLDEASSAKQAIQQRLTLREALKAELDNATKIHKEDAPTAEAITRLNRRVEAQSMSSALSMELQNQNSSLLGGINGAIGANGMQDGLVMANSAGLGMSGNQAIDDAIAAAAAGGGDLMGLGSMGDGMMGLGDDDLLNGMDMKLEF